MLKVTPPTGVWGGVVSGILYKHTWSHWRRKSAIAIWLVFIQALTTEYYSHQWGVFVVQGHLFLLAYGVPDEKKRSGSLVCSCNQISGAFLGHISPEIYWSEFPMYSEFYCTFSPIILYNIFTQYLLTDTHICFSSSRRAPANKGKHSYILDINGSEGISHLYSEFDESSC